MSTGALGYNDFQSQASWDSGQDDFATLGAQTGPIVSGVLNCSNFGYTYIRAVVTVGSVLCTARWFRDMAGAAQRGSRTFVLDAGTINPAQVVFPSMGPFFTLTIDPLGGGVNWTGNVFVIFTNRIHPLACVPQNAPLGGFTFTLPAGGSQIFQVPNYFAGPVDYYTASGSQGVNVLTQYMNNALVWNTLESYTVIAGPPDYRHRTLPLAPYRFNVTNASGTIANNTASVQTMASLTGSG